MSVPSYVRRHINNLAGDKPFSIRDFLVYGPRNTIDQVFYRLINAGYIIRVARGVFVKSGNPMPSAAEVAEVKAKAFNKVIVTHGLDAAQGLAANRPSKCSHIFATNGATSSFRVGRHLVRFKRISQRKMHLGDCPVGLLIRALWQAGKKACSVETAAALTCNFGPEDRRKLRVSAAFMPAWMRDCLAKFCRMDCTSRDLQSVER